MRDIAFGQMYPVDSPIHRADPRAKLLITIAYITMIFFIKSFAVFGVTALFVLIVILISRVPLLKVLKSVRAIIFLLIFTFLITVFLQMPSGTEGEVVFFEAGIFALTSNGLISGGKLVCRLLLLIIGPALLTLTTTPVALTDAIEYLLSPLKLIKVPVHTFALIMSIALRLVPTLMEETDKIIAAQKARGASFDHGNIFKRAKALLPVLIPLFINSFRRSEELADAMDSRCYHGAKGRTKLKIMRFSPFDYIAMLVMVILFFIVLMMTFNWWGIAFISTITAV